jgi:hypothetical protein
MQFRWRTPQMEASLAVRENTPHGRDQSIEFYRLAVNPAASAFSRSPASACAERAMTGMSTQKPATRGHRVSVSNERHGMVPPSQYFACTPQFWPRHDGGQTDADVLRQRYAIIAGAAGPARKTGGQIPPLRFLIAEEAASFRLPSQFGAHGSVPANDA